MVRKIEEYIRIIIIRDYFFVHFIPSCKSNSFTVCIVYYKRISITPLNICNVSDSIINGLMSSNKSVFSSILFYLNFHRQIIMLLIFVS